MSTLVLKSCANEIAAILDIEALGAAFSSDNISTDSVLLTICLDAMQLTFMMASIPSSEVGRRMMELIDTCSHRFSGG